MADCIFKVRMTSDKLTFRLPTNIQGTYDFTVNYGDGTGDKAVTTYNGTNASHTYASADDYTVTITSGGTFTRWLSGDAVNFRAVVLEIVQWGDIGITDMGSGLRECDLLTVTATDAGAFGNITNFYAMFWGSALANPDVSSWDMSAAEDISYMFSQANAASPDTRTWDISSVTDGTQFAYNSDANDTYYQESLEYWATLSLQSNVVLDYDASTYISDRNRKYIEDTFNWTFNDGTDLLRPAGDAYLVYYETLFASSAKGVAFNIDSSIQDDDVVFFWAHKDDDTGGSWYVSSSAGGSDDQGFTNKINLSSTAYNDINSALLFKRITDRSSEPAAGTQWWPSTSDSDGLYVTMFVVRGLDVTSDTTVFDSVTPTLTLRGNTAAPAGASITTNTAGCAIFTAIGTDPAAVYSTTITDTDTDTDAYTLLGQNKDVNGISSAMALASQSAAGATGDVTWGGDNGSDDHHVLVVALKPGAITRTGTGDLDAGSATVAGAGTGPSIVHSGVGSLEAGTCAVAGAGLRIVTATGDLDAGSAAITSIGIRLSAGTGAINADVAAISGAGSKLIQGTGDLYAAPPAIAGEGRKLYIGTGLLQATPADVDGITKMIRTGTGSLQAEQGGYVVRNSSGTVFSLYREVEVGDG